MRPELARILAHRLFATVTQEKLWPRAGAGGTTFARARSPNEGLIDKYYTYTATVDTVGVGRRAWEITIANMVELVEHLKKTSLDEIYRRRE